jgi:subtilisin family serine protease
MNRIVRCMLPLVSSLLFASALSAQVKPVDVTSLRLPAGSTASALPRTSRAMSGKVEVIVRLTDAPLAAVAGNKRTGLTMTAAQQRAYLATLAQKQSTVMAQIRALGGVEIVRLAKAHNAVIVSVDAARLPSIAKLAGVSMIRPVVDYELVLSETVPYIGAAAVQQLGFDGTGVRVAVLDTGVDYTHRNLGGPGTLAAYQAAYGTSPSDPKNTTRDGLFPTAKVIGGFDFVGEKWPGTGAAPDDSLLTHDPDPIDFNGHGTHVADIIAGHSLDGAHKGVAPGASLYAVKVCSSISTACSGIAMLEGIEFALDPNGDGDISDAVDVINMSIGKNYGQREEDTAEASAIASRFGVVVVAAAGNSANLPFVSSSPANTPEVIGVAQTQVPSATAIPLVINSPASIAGSYANTQTLDFAPVDTTVTGNVAFVGRGCPAGSVDGTNPDDPYLASPAGKIALIDRGACTVSLKIDRAAKAGAIGVLIGLVAPGDAVGFSFGGGDTFVPTLVITQAISNLIKSTLQTSAVNATISPANAIALVGSMVSSSSRGPGYSYISIKPDIGAPGASVSAVVGTGTGEEAFGGTSGASPMIAGSAALVLQAYPSLQPFEVKARLMNSAATNIFTNPALVPGELAPITRIGSGEIRVDKSVMVSTAAWDAADPASVSLSVGGYRLIGASNVLRKKVLVRNYASMPRSYTITPSFRYANDAASGAVTLAAPASIAVPPNGTATFTLTMTVNANKLPAWTMNGGPNGGNGALLNLPEYDGYVTIADSHDVVHLPWHILPHRSANVQPATKDLHLNGALIKNLALTNTGGAVAGRVDSFYLMGTSAQIPSVFQPHPGDNYAVIDLRRVGARLVNVGGGNFGVQFAINTFGQRAHPNYPAEFDIYIDTDNDGEFDYVVFNSENGGFGVTGQNVVTVVNLATGDATTRFFADADLVSSNMIMTATLADLGIGDPTQPFTFFVFAFDNYFTGALTDFVGPMQIALANPRFFGSGVPSAGVPVNGTSNLTVQRFASGDAASPDQTGLLLMYRDGRNGMEADAVTIEP